MKKRKRIVLLLSSISRRNGGASSLLDATEALNDLGYDLYIALTGSSLPLYLIKDYKSTKTSLSFNKILSLPPNVSKYLRNPANKFSLKTIKQKKAMYGRTWLYEAVGRLFAFCINYTWGIIWKKKVLRILSTADVIIASSFFLTGAKESLLKHSSAKLMLNHAGSVQSFERYILKDIHAPANSNPELSRYVNFMSQFDRILFQANDQAEVCANQYKMLINKPLVIKPSCHEQEVLASKQQDNPYSQTTFNITVVGSLIPRKAQHYAITAFKKIRGIVNTAELHFVGGGVQKEYGQKLIELVNELNLSNSVFFHGHRRDYLRYMAHASMILQTSEAEGVSRILRETMLLNKPIVSFAIPGTSDILENNREALLIEPFDVDKLSDGIIDLINKPDLREQLAKNAQKRYFLEHSKAAYYSNWIKAINEICYNYDES